MNILIAFAVGVILSSATAPALQNPCTLLKPAEVRKALGVQVAAGNPESVLGGKACRWMENDSSGGYQNVYVQLSDDGAFTLKTVKGSGAKPVRGAGVPAVFWGGNVYMLKGNTAVVVGITHGEQNNTTVDPKLPALAKLVYGRVR
jgi:hypothetical protein